MDKTTLQFFTAIKNGEVKHIGKSIIIQPEVKFGGGTIKWFDDKQLVKNKGEETCLKENIKEENRQIRKEYF